ncbi:hypothetical protein Bca52824_000055 [Brassica carinata]|uniref:MENTAL domain-containing protein n=1 Tax=Brassica carinata TaxID=52824 RepID=A0A8X7WHE5_BRACI|nr:hypothetical protein Bca52824_000055 [Brassica carinata]
MGLISKEEVSKARRYSSSFERSQDYLRSLHYAPLFHPLLCSYLPRRRRRHPPSAILSSSSSLLRLSPTTVSSHLSNYDFRYSLIDIPLISIIRSAIILCVYGLCDGPKLSRGPYLTITMFCSISSLIYVSCKAAFVFGEPVIGGGSFRTEEVALFVCSSVLAIGHIVVAYRTSCRERRKLLVFKIDIESVSACKNVFPRHQKILLQERLK